MKYLLNIPIIIAGIVLLQSCTKTESDFSAARVETITVSANTLNVTTGTAVSFTVLSSLNNSTADSKIYVNGNLITGNSYTFLNVGNFAVYASKGLLTSNVITINVTATLSNTSYKHHVLVEEYSGTWCGNCPRILYGVDLLKQQTDRVIVVSTHLFNGDPFITPEGNNLAAQQGVTSVPAGFINRTISWTGPQYQNVSQVITNIQASAAAGVAVRSSITNNNLSVVVNVGYTAPLNSNAKLAVYLVEDKLSHTQANYSTNLYDGLSSIPNFKYDGVIRKVISSLSGDVINSTANNFEKSYSLAVPASVTAIANTRVVAFITNAAGTVVNAQQVKTGEEKTLEVL